MIYRFIDTADRTPRADIPAEAMNINGQYLEDVVPGYRTLSVAGRESMSAEVNTLDAGRENGVQYNYRRYPERVITITYQILSGTPEDFRRAFNALGGALNCEQVKLIFNDELDKYFIGTPGEIGEIEPGKNKVTGEFQIVCTDPFKYSLTEYKTRVDTNTPKKILYGGTVPTFPYVYTNCTSENDGGLWFETLSIDDNLLMFTKQGTRAEHVSTSSNYTTTTEDGWTYHTEIYPGEEDAFTIAGKINYEPRTATDIFIIDVTGAGGGNYTPKIRFYRDYYHSSGTPLTELQFLIGYDIVYRETIDDNGKFNRFPFRLSFEHTPILVSTRLGQMTGTYYFQVGDTVYETRKSWAWSVSDNIDAISITGAMLEAAFYLDYSHPSGIDGSIIHYYDTPFTSGGSMFPYNDVTIIKPETEEVLVAELNTPQYGNPANRWEDFKLQPGENTLNCSAMGVDNENFHCTFYWREKYI